MSKQAGYKVNGVRLTIAQSAAVDALRAAASTEKGCVTPSITIGGIQKSTLNALVARGLAKTDDGWHFVLAGE